MHAAQRLERWGRDEHFRAQPVPTLLLDDDLVIRAANPAYLSATVSTEDQLLGQPMFEAFPDNPDTPEANSVANLHQSFERTLTNRTPNHMKVQRYDVPDRRNADGFITKIWIPVNAPAADGDDLLGVIHRVVDVTPLPEQALTKMAATRYEVAPVDDAPVWEGLAAALNEFAALARQNRQLQEALTSRATIDQAKGMLMLRCACGPEEAFALLKRASQNTNVRLAHVAAAMVHQARNGEAAVIDMIHASMDALPDTAT